MYALRDLINIGNNHFMKSGAKNANATQLKAIATFVYEILHMFGAAEECADFGLIRYSETDLGKIVTEAVAVAKRFLSSIDTLADDRNKARIADLTASFVEQCQAQLQIDLSSPTAFVAVTSSREYLDDFLDMLAGLRQSIRAVSIENKWRQFLSECDVLRDEGLASIGVRLQDTDEQIPAVGLMPVWAQDKKPAKAAPPKVVVKKKIDASVEPRRMFSLGQYEGLFSLYDDDGLPTHDAAGAEVSKTKKSKFKKLMAEQQKLYEKFVSQ